MFSMAIASLALPFLPLLPKQILLTNLLTDFPELTIATDNVDREWVDRPQRWNVAFIRRFMLVFGPLSSTFDLVTFGLLLLVLQGGAEQFRTGWFIESVVSAAMVVLVVRTRRNPLLSRPSRYLLGATLLIAAVAVAIPFTPLARPFGFVAIPPAFLGFLALVIALYMLTAALAVRWFYRSVGLSGDERKSAAERPAGARAD
jgi:Mg2+-importing ATPase